MYRYSTIYLLMLALYKSGQTLIQLIPYVAAGVVLGEALKLTSWTRLTFRGIDRSPFLAIVTAAILGMISPLCTYGTVPVVLLLLQSGVSLAPLATFLSASAMMNPQLFVMTWGGLGIRMALLRAGAVFLFGVLLGTVLYRLPEKWILNRSITIKDNIRSEISGRRAKACGWGRFIADVLQNLQFVGFYMVIGIIAGSLIEVFIPDQWVKTAFTPGKWTSVLFAAAMGVPVYACGGGTIPLIKTLLSGGMGEGAALAFFLVGPATRPTPLMALAAVFRPVFIAAYVLLVIIFSLVVGLVYG